MDKTGLFIVVLATIIGTGFLVNKGLNILEWYLKEPKPVKGRRSWEDRL